MPSVKSILITAAIALAVIIANEKGLFAKVGGKGSSLPPPPVPPSA